MEEQVVKYIEALKKISEPDIRDNYTLQSWKAKAINIVTRLYGANSKQEEQINLIKYKVYASAGTFSGGRYEPSGDGTNSLQCQKQASELIKGFISDLEDFGLPEKVENSEHSGINITVSQNQSQQVRLKLLTDAIQNELTGRQLKELQELIEIEEKADVKRKKIFDKLKSFGSDIGSNIIANILTNPTIFGG